jgi:hypothetical protein
LAALGRFPIQTQQLRYLRHRPGFRSHLLP